MISVLQKGGPLLEREQTRRLTLLQINSVLFLAIILGIATYHMIWHWSYKIDDAYITYRYADNLAEGKGFVFNEGERVEGTSTFLFTIILSVPLFFGADALVASKVVGLLSVLVLIVYVYLFVTLASNNPTRFLYAPMAALLTAANSSLIANAMSGMETSFYICLLFMGVYYYVRGLRRSQKKCIWPMTMALVSMTRPEGFAFFGMLVALDVARQLIGKRSSSAILKDILAHILWFAALFGPFLLFRILYFGELLPNSVVAKDGYFTRIKALPLEKVLPFIQKGDGIKKFKEFWGEYYSLPALFALLPVCFKKLFWPQLALIGATMGVIAVSVWNEGGWMPYYRLLAPVAPFVSVGLCLGMYSLQEIERRRRFGVFILAMLAVPFYLMVLNQNFNLRKPIRRNLAVYAYLEHVGKTLKRVGEKDDLLATDIAGVVPYYSKMKTIDMKGLCNHYIARNGRHSGKGGKDNYPYVIKQNPTFFVLNYASIMRSIARTDPTDPSEWFVVATPYFLKGRQRRHLKAIMVRKDHKNLHNVARSLNAKLLDLETEIKRGRYR